MLIDDNEGDIFLFSEYFESSKERIDFSYLKDGQSALDYLLDPENQKAKHFPDVILLDINLPRKNGLEVLKQIKGDEALRKMPVIMFTTSSSPNDIEMSYDFHANSFVTKPVDANQYSYFLSRLEEYWFQIVSLT